MHFRRLPAILPMYLQAAVSTRPRHPAPDTDIPVLHATASPLEANVGHIRRFARLVGHRHDNVLPPTYPQILAAPLHLAMFTAPQFPLNPTGIVHLRNTITIEEPIDIAAPLTLQTSLAEGEESVRGRQLVMTTIAAIGERPVWRAEAGLLARFANPAGRDKRARRRIRTSGLQAIETIDVGANTGRRYARASGDYNPIHLSTISARLFGFDHAIAHGMWSLARVLGCLDEIPAAANIEVEFRRPLLMPASVEVAADPVQPGGFALRDATTGKNYLEGMISEVT
ncbi:MAG: hypothetical protein HKN49_10125 [Gammaproteobacteria bacterium]|nr:hypothetical protein [Gammaproteobacteria bacterium]